MTTITWTLPGKNIVMTYHIYDDATTTYDQSSTLYGGKNPVTWTLQNKNS